MIRISFVFLLFLFLSSCAATSYQRECISQSGMDFSKGRWLLGNIEVDAYVKDELTELVMKDFSEHLKDRLVYSLHEKTLLLATKVPFNPTKSAILDLKTGTGYDYYINMKCQNARNDISNFDYLAHDYYIKQMSYGRVFMEIYDLNKGTIIYRQGYVGSLDEYSALTDKPKRKVLLGCYAKIMKEINKNSIGVAH